MRLPKVLSLIFVSIFALGGSAPSAAAQPRAGDPLQIYVTNYPLKYFAERIAAEHAVVMLPVPEGIDPAFWMPDALAIASYQKADLILLNGAGYEQWINQVSLPELKLVDTSAGFSDQYIMVEGAVTHTHGPTGEHAHEGTAFTTWLDFGLAGRQAKAIADELVRLRPALGDVFRRNFSALQKELNSLDKRAERVVASDPDRKLIASHPVYQYLARRYGLHMRSLHWEPEQVPNEQQWRTLEMLLEEHPAKWMIWEGEPASATLAKLDSKGIASVVFDPCANRPERGDFLSVMRQNVEHLAKVYR